ncbi:uncharacterized protein H6S33_011686, partial [Morchella sextelata]|uniref:uncharacterized protein n=1 Tax=Morchella sextelata TaxID=1174677 RepID=UPI001D03E5BD
REWKAERAIDCDIERVIIHNDATTSSSTLSTFRIITHWATQPEPISLVKYFVKMEPDRDGRLEVVVVEWEN